MNDDEKLFEEHFAMRIIISVVMDGLRDRPELKQKLVIASLDAALESDSLHICGTIARLLEA